MDLFDLAAKITLDSSEYERGLNKASGKLSGFGSKLKSGLATAAKVSVAAVGAAGTALGALLTQSVKAYGEYEQLVGGAKKIFDQMDYSRIAEDAANAWSTMNLSASQYLSMMNSVGATFAATMGDEKGYETAKRGMQAIADYASGTGKNVEELNQKFALITRSSSSYQSIADQFSGILPATSKDFLTQAQAAGYLSTKYKELTKVPINEYQEAVALMLEKGVDDLNLTGNTAEETAKTITGSLAGMKAAWANLITGLGDPNADLNSLFDNLRKNAKNFLSNIRPVVKAALSSIGSLVKDLAPIIAEELPELVEEVLPDLIAAATSLVGSLAKALPKILKVIWKTVDDAISKSKFGETWSRIKESVSKAVEGIKEAWDRLKEKLQPLIEKVSEAWQKFKDWEEENHLLEAAIDFIGTAIKGVILFAGDLVSAFDGMWGAAKDAANWVLEKWQPVSSFFSSLAEKIAGIFNIEPGSAAMSGGGYGGRTGGFAIGNDYVPYNGYRAVLHRGEAVLTAREADAWRRGEGSGRQIVNNWTFNGVSQSDLDYIAGYINRELVSG